MAQGIPVVSTAELGTRSVLRPESGALVVPEEVDAFAAAAIHLLQDPALRVRLGSRAREYARSWSSATFALRLRQLYAGLLVGRATARPAMEGVSA